MKRLSSFHPAIQESVVYGTGTLVSQVISALRGLMIASMLGPASYGLWKSVQVVLEWLPYTHFGVLHGMARQIPLSRRSGDPLEENASRGTGLFASVVSGIVAGGLLIAVTYRTSEVAWGIWVGIAGLVFLTQLFRFVHMICLADGRFAVLSASNLILAILSFVLMAVSVPSYGVYGVLLGLGGGYVGALILAGWRSIFRGGWRGYSLWGMTQRLAVTGFPFMAVDGLFVFWQRLDRMVLIPFYGAESVALGYYGLATMVASFAIQIPQVFTRVLFRRTVPVFGNEVEDTVEARTARKRHLETPCLLVSSISPLLLSLGTLASWLMVFYFLPEYSSFRKNESAGCEESIALLMFAAYGCGVGLAFRNIYTGINRQWRLAGIYGIACFASILPPVLVLSGVGEVEVSRIGIAGWGMALGSALFMVLTLVDCCRLRGSSPHETHLLLWRALGPGIVYLVWTLSALERPYWFSQSPSEWTYWAVLIMSALLLHAPIALLGVRKVWREIHPSEEGFG